MEIDDPQYILSYDEIIDLFIEILNADIVLPLKIQIDIRLLDILESIEDAQNSLSELSMNRAVLGLLQEYLVI